MCNPLRNFPLGAEVEQTVHDVFAALDEIPLGLDLGKPNLGICCHGLFQALQTRAGIMKIRDRLMKSVAWKRGDEALESAKSLCRLVGLAFALNDVVGSGSFDEQVSPPVFALLVAVVREAVFCGENCQ